jgi:hypothetical protein
MNDSHKHHYLPQHYLRGFVDDSGLLYVYDKQKDNIFKSGPPGVFFENDLNTVVLANGETEDFLEETYTYFETNAWPAFDRIRQSNSNTPIDLLDEMYLFHFLLFLYWRLPVNASEVRRLSHAVFEETGDLDYFRFGREDGSKAPQELIEMIRQSPAFEKVFRQVLPYAPFYKNKDWPQTLRKWYFYYTADMTGWFVVGDNPIIQRRNQTTDIIHPFEKFIFPISSSILLVSMDPIPRQDLTSIFTIQFGAAIIENSQRFVAGRNKEFLKDVVKFHHDVYIKYIHTDRVIDDLFDML